MASVNPRKRTKQAPIGFVCASARAKQYDEDFYAEGNVLFCKFCDHSVDYKRLDTLKDHLLSKKHGKNKCAKLPVAIIKLEGDDAEQQVPFRHSGIRQVTLRRAGTRQVTLPSGFKSKHLREDFILDFVRLCTLADIPLEKVEKMRPFMAKHCKQGGVLPQAPTLRRVYVPRQFQVHFATLKRIVRDAKVSIVVNDTVRDQGVTNVVAGVQGSYYLIDVCVMEVCDYSTLSQAVIQAVTNVGIRFEDVISVVTGSAATCQKAAREVLQPIFHNSCHVPCLAHIVNVSAQVFQHWPEFGNVATIVKMIKAAFLKKAARKARYLRFLKDFLPKEQVKLPPVPVSTRWNSWFDAVNYHATHLQHYKVFFKREGGRSTAVQTILGMTRNEEVFAELQLHMSFIKENCARFMVVLMSLGEVHEPLACTAYNLIEDLRFYQHVSSRKTIFGAETDLHLSKKEKNEKQMTIKSFNDVFKESLRRFSEHIEGHPAFLYYKALRIFDPRQLGSLSHDIKDHRRIPGLKEPSPQVLEEWVTYIALEAEEIPEDVNVSTFWKSVTTRCRYPHLAAIARDAIWMPVVNIDVGRNLLRCKHLLNGGRDCLIPTNARMTAMMYFNGDIEQQFRSQSVFVS
uniref:uncharacterized protein n=1 Tax=Myxine glutinosa TaxID=7769 RepID=UPI00358FF509